MKLLEKILFPMDFGENAESIQRNVITVAKKFDSEVLIVHVLPKEVNNEHVNKVVHEKLDSSVKEFKKNNIECSYKILEGNYSDKIIEIAERRKVNLILFGAGKTKIEESKLGSNAEKIIRFSSVPVWVIDNHSVFQIKTVLCPVDFSEESKVALDGAIHLCRRFDAKLIVFHVVKSFSNEYRSLGIDLESEESSRTKVTSTKFDEFLKDANFFDLDWEKELVAGDPAKEIINAIKFNNTDLMVLGSANKTWLKKVFIGSVSENVIRKVPCSFIINKEESLIHLKLEENLSDIDAIYDEGVQLAKDGYTKEAIDMWKECTYMNEFYLKAWTAIATLYEDMGDSENADKFTKAKEKIQRSIWDKQVESDLRGSHEMFK